MINFIKKNKENNLNFKVNPEKDCIKYIKSSAEKKFTNHKYSDSIVRSDYCNCLVSIIFNTNNIEKTISTLEKFFEKTNNPEKIQFCIKIDNNETEFVNNFLEKISKIQFNFVIIASPKGRGFIDLWQWVNYLFKVSSKNSKFIINISDEMCVEEKGWDKNLKRYINLEEDNLYRLRTSVYKNRNYNDLWECGYAPDTTAIYTRKYLNLQSNFSPCFGPDNGQQIVAYYLSKLNYPRHVQFLRDKVINDITFSGQGTNIGLSHEKLITRKNINHLLWLNLFSFENQTKLFQRARKIQIEIIKNKVKDMKIIELREKYILMYDEKNNQGNHVSIKLTLSKRISYLKLFFYNILRLDFFKYNTGYDQNKIISLLISIFFLINKKFPENMLSKKEDTFLESVKVLESRTILISRTRSKISFAQEFLLKYPQFSGTLRPIINFTENIKVFKFIEFYSLVFAQLVFWMSVILYCIIIFKRIPSIKTILIYQCNRYFSSVFRKRSIIFADDSDQSKSFIVKGD